MNPRLMTPGFVLYSNGAFRVWIRNELAFTTSLLFFSDFLFFSNAGGELGSMKHVTELLCMEQQVLPSLLAHPALHVAPHVRPHACMQVPPPTFYNAGILKFSGII